MKRTNTQESEAGFRLLDEDVADLAELESLIGSGTEDDGFLLEDIENEEEITTAAGASVERALAHLLALQELLDREPEVRTHPLIVRRLEGLSEPCVARQERVCDNENHQKMPGSPDDCAETQEPDLSEISEMWAERDKRLRVQGSDGAVRKENPIDFVERVYARWVGNGLARSHLLPHDPQLYQAITNWARKPGNHIPEDVLPTYHGKWLDDQITPEELKIFNKVKAILDRKRRAADA